ncbi:unnamed protein product [Merluccius merluccius]
MSRGACPRVIHFRGYLWILLAASVSAVSAYSCHEVRTAFQLRQIGPVSRVPETPGTDVDLSVCKHQGPSCCTRKMEESYQYAVKRDTTQNIRSYSFELKFILTGHASAFQGKAEFIVVATHRFGTFGCRFACRIPVDAQSAHSACGASKCMVCATCDKVAR